MNDNKNKKTETDIDKTILFLAKKNIPQLAKNKNLFKLGVLFVYLLMIKINKKNMNNDKNKPKNKLTKKDICIYMAEHIQEFRMLYLYYVKKKYPKMKKREKIGLDSYNNIINNKQRNWEEPSVYKKLTKHCQTIYTIENINKKKYKIII
tara:strand:+ start:110 stop:559 length:450 start_codon:yes stop_codon:yes gene_type:complete